MKNLRSGENSAVEAQQFVINVQCHMTDIRSGELDVSAFLLSGNEKVRSDQDFIFYNQPSSKDGCITLTATDNDQQTFNVKLDKVADDVQKIVFVITSPVAFSAASKLLVTLDTHMQYQPDTSSMEEKSLKLVELYRRNNQWKFRAIGQGFKGGLAPLATAYGVDIDDEEPQDSKPEVSQPNEPSKPKPTIPLTKTVIDLKKSGEKATISLAKNKNIMAKLKWDTAADLDLYCFYVDEQEAEEKIYYRNQGSLDTAPFIKLHGDSQNAGEEVLEISQPEHLKYALTAAYSAVSNGIGSFKSYKARVVVSDGANQEVTSHLAHKDPYSYWVAFALIDFTTKGQITIHNVETYSNKKTFARQFEERTGSKPGGLFKRTASNVNGVTSYDSEKSPFLFKDGSFMMSVGVREFK